MQLPLSALRPGQVIQGKVEAFHFYFGIVVDIGYEHHGILPVPEDVNVWEGVQACVELGAPIRSLRAQGALVLNELNMQAL